MSFGPSTTTKTAENNLSGISSTAVNSQLPTEMAAGSNLMGMGGANVQSGTNFLQTLLGGNAANTTAALQPSIDQIRGGTTNTLNAINTLTPRGGGRSGALFSQSFAPQSQIQSLFNNARTSAATALPQIGLQQTGQGANLFGLGNQALQVGTGASTGLGQMGLQQQQMNNQLAAGLGGGLFSLATTPLSGGMSGGGKSLLGLLGL